MTSTCKIFQLGATHFPMASRHRDEDFEHRVGPWSFKTFQPKPKEEATTLRICSQREISKWNNKMQTEDVGKRSRPVFETTSECNFVSWLPWIPICFRHVIYIDIYIYTSILWSHHQLAILKPIRATGWIENWRIELTKKKLQKWVSSSIDLYIC